VSWPHHVRHGVSEALVSHIDFLASLAAFSRQTLADADGPDSQNLWPALTGQPAAGRDVYVEQGSGLSLRQGRWKYIEPSNRRRMNPETNTELGNDTSPQLYDLSTDPGERTNMAKKFPARVKEMQRVLEEIRTAGRSRR
jgi:arylsulfatase A-like enzyme